jgi:hypothetical protein
MVEPVRYQKEAIKKNVPYLLIWKKYWRSFVGVSIAWFLYDFIVSPNVLPHKKVNVHLGTNLTGIPLRPLLLNNSRLDLRRHDLPSGHFWLGTTRFTPRRRPLLTPLVNRTLY